MQTHFSARELAALKCPGLPASERRIRMRAHAESWPARRRAQRGGEAEYPLSALPEAAQAHVRAEFAALAVAREDLVEKVEESLELIDRMDAMIEIKLSASDMAQARWEKAAREQQVREEGLKKAVTLSDQEQKRVSAKLHVLQAFEVFHKNHVPPVGLTVASFAFETAYRAGTVPIDPSVRALFPELSRATLCRWRAALRDGGLAGLRDGWGKRKGQGTIDQQPVVRDFILACIHDAPHLRMTSLMENLKARFRGKPDVYLPSARALERWVTAWKAENEQQHTFNSNPDAWKSRFQSATGDASALITAPNALWELDSSPADVMLVDGRHVLIAAVDVYTRRLKVLVSKTSKAEAVGLLLRRAILDWGVPKAALTDNGKDYVSQHVHALLYSLRIEHRLCLPFASEQKPHVERAFGTLTRDLSERLAGYIGHNVAERQAIRARKSFAERLAEPGAVVEVKLSSDELQAVVDEWIENKYHQAEHSGLDGLTPLQVLGGWSGEPVSRIGDERALDMLLAPAPGDGFRTVGKKGIRLGGSFYLAPNHELVGFEGKRVKVRHDPRDLGKIAVYGGADGEFICTAVCAELLGIDRAEYAATNKAMQKKLMREGLAHGKRLVRELRVGDVVGEIRGTWRTKSGQILAFRASEVEHDTPELRAALAAAEGRDTDPTAIEPHDEEVLAAGAYVADFEAERQRLLDVEEPIDKFMRLAERLKGGGQVDEAEARFMRHFETTREYRGWLMVQEAAAAQHDTQA